MVSLAQKTEHPSISHDIRLRLFHQLLRIRRVEEAIAKRYGEQEMRCPTHLSIGQEAVSVGVCENLTNADYVLGSHRSHAPYLAQGGDLNRFIAELYGKETGCAGGRGGSMHLVDLEVGFLGCVPIVGSTIPIGVGAAFSSKFFGKKNVSVMFFGDGATEEGVFYESLSFAKLHKLPVLFVCENNSYAISSRLEDRRYKNQDIKEIVKSFNIEVSCGDGQNVDEVFALSKNCIEKIKLDGQPRYLELSTFRYLENCGPNRDRGFRPDEEIDAWMNRDPVDIARDNLMSEGLVADQDIADLEEKIETEIAKAFDFARNSPFPDRSELFKKVYKS